MTKVEQLVSQMLEGEDNKCPHCGGEGYEAGKEGHYRCRSCKKHFTKHRLDPLMGESEQPCPHCHQAESGRRKELADRGWRMQGWGGDIEWVNPARVYYVRDEVVDSLPPEEWETVVGMTEVTERPDSRLAGMDDRASQTQAKQAASSYLSNTRPKAYMVGDPTTIGMSVGGS